MGNRIIVGGTFTLVEPQSGQPGVPQSYLYIYDVNTGLLDANQFVVDGRVNVIVGAAEADHIYIGGKFNTVNGVTKRKLAKLDLATGTVANAFTAQTNGTVAGLALDSGVLYVTGGFAAINGDSAVGLAAVDATTGAVRESFDLPLTQYIGQLAGVIGQRIAVTPDGSTLVVMHRAMFIDGLERRGVAMVDLTGPVASVTNWRTNFWDPTSTVGIVDGELSPDGSYLMIVGIRGDAPPWRDTAIAFPVAGGSGVETLWVTRNHDSTYAVAISDDAVFIGGHFCWTQGPNAPDPWAPLAPQGRCPNKTRRDNTNVYRNTIAALDPVTGRAALKWVPWSDAGNGIRSIEVVPRGLLVGGDQLRTTEVRTGRSALFDRDDMPPTNLAHEGTATQSSTDIGAGPERAVDGNRDDKWFTMTITLTETESQPWWDVDLGSLFDVDSVEIWNRGGQYSSRLDDVWVFTSGLPFASDDPTALANDPNVTSTFLPGEQGYRTLVNIGAQARYVRVQLRGTGILSLSEVRVFEGTGGDATPPTATIVSPASGSLVMAPVDLSGSASDDIGVDRVIVEVRNRDTKQWLRDDGSWGAWMEVNATLVLPGGASVTWSYSIATILNGRYKAYVRAVDTSGNTHAKIERKFDVGTVDLILPTGTITAPLENETLPSPVVLAGLGEDNVGVDHVRIELRNRDTALWLRSDGTFGGWQALTATLADPGAGSTIWTYVTPDLVDGRYKMFITVYDGAGNKSQQLIRKFRVS